MLAAFGEALPVEIMAPSENRSSKSDCRRKPEARMPNQEAGAGIRPHFSKPSEDSFRHSDFGLLSDFGDSAFGFQVQSLSRRVEALAN
jgi:hypothetical protein